MGLRTSLATFLSAPATRLLERDLRELVEDVLASRPLVQPEELAALREELSAAPSSGADPRVDALEREVASLKKKLNMATGAIQASTAQLMSVKQGAEEALTLARKASQHATSGQATAEAAIDGLTGVEERLASLIERLGNAPAGSSEEEDDAGEGCKVPDCPRHHRARGFCGPHYQKYRRSTLEGYVGPDGVVPLGEQTFKVARKYAGEPATLSEEGRVLIHGEKVSARRQAQPE